MHACIFCYVDSKDPDIHVLDRCNVETAGMHHSGGQNVTASVVSFKKEKKEKKKKRCDMQKSHNKSRVPNQNGVSRA